MLVAAIVSVSSAMLIFLVGTHRHYEGTKIVITTVHVNANDSSNDDDNRVLTTTTKTTATTRHDGNKNCNMPGEKGPR